MSTLHDSQRPPPRRAPGHRPGRSLAVGGLVLAGLGLAACGGSAASPTILNTEKVERSIEHSTLAQRSIPTQVSCPSGVHQKKGIAFSCTAVTRRGTTRFAVTQVDGAGHVHYVGR